MGQQLKQGNCFPHFEPPPTILKKFSIGKGIMKVLVAADLHGKSRSLETLNLSLKSFSEELDLVCICGDITTFGDWHKAQQMLDSLETGFPILVVPGNCDPPEVLRGIEASKATNLHGRSFELDGHVFIGWGGAETNNTHGCQTEEAGSRLEALIAPHPPQKVHLVFHCPPKGYLDKGYGHPLFRELVENYWPASVFSGHIHEEKGWMQNEHSFFLNPGPAAGGHYAVVEIRDEGVELVVEA